MNARDELVSALTNGWLCYGIGSREGYEAEASSMVDAYAHELAEKIRAEEARMKRDFVLEEDEGWAAADAADLIDPHANDD